MAENKQDIFSALDKIMAETDIKDVTADSIGFEELPEGYYLSKLESAELTTSKSSGNPMVAMKFSVVTNGISETVDADGNMELSEIPSTRNRKIFKYYPIKDSKSLKQFVTDMLKFEDAATGESILPKEAFLDSHLLNDSLDSIIGETIYIMNSLTTDKEGKPSSFKNLISWTRAAQLELPM